MSNMPPARSNREAFHLLERGWVIVRKEDVPAKAKKYIPSQYGNGVTGDTWTRTDDYNFGGHRDWLPPGSAGQPRYIFGLGLTLTGRTVDLDAATDTTIGGLTEPPLDNQPYARSNGQWVLANGADHFMWSTSWTPTGNEPISAMPQFQFVIPVASLPNQAFDWNSFPFISNKGLGAQAVTGNGGAWAIDLEYPFGSGTWIQIASFAFDARTFPDEDMIVKGKDFYANGFRVWHFDPATDGGIRFGIRFEEGQNFGNPWNVLIGLQGEIVTL